MLSAYRVIDATDHRGQVAGMILAALGAEVILAEPPEGSPHRRRGDGLEFWAYNRGKRSVVCPTDDAVLELVRDADVLLDSGGRFDPAVVAAANPAIVHVTVSAFGSDGPKADWAASDLTILAAGCSQALNGDSDRAPVRTSVPQAWLHAGAEAAVGALLALTERVASGRGQHVDVSAQQAVLQAAIPGVLLAPNDNPEAQRTSGGILAGPVHLQFVYPAADGYVSITLLFGSMIGPFTRRLMEWVCDEGHCTADMRDWDWNAFGLRLATAEEGPAELEAVKAAVTAMTSRHTKAELFAEAQRRRVLLAPVTTPSELVAMEHLRERGYWEDVDGRTCPGAFVHSTAWPLPTLGAPPAIGEHDVRPGGPTPAAPSSRAAPSGALPLDGLKVVDLTWVFAGPLATRVLADFGATVVKVEGPDASRRVTWRRRCAQRRPRPRGQHRLRPLQLRQAEPHPRPVERGGPRRAARPRPLGRRPHRVVHARCDGRVGPRARGAAGDQPAPDHAEHEPDGPDRSARRRSPGSATSPVRSPGSTS